MNVLKDALLLGFMSFTWFLHPVLAFPLVLVIGFMSSAGFCQLNAPNNESADECFLLSGVSPISRASAGFCQLNAPNNESADECFLLALQGLVCPVEV